MFFCISITILFFIEKLSIIASHKFALTVLKLENGLKIMYIKRFILFLSQVIKLLQ